MAHHDDDRKESVVSNNGSDIDPSLKGRREDSGQNNEAATAESPSGSPPAAEYPTGLRLAIIIIGLELAVLCVALDNTIIATAIPRITDQFHALNDVGWYGSAYLLTLSAFQLFFGRLYSILNIKWTFLVSLFIFELGSLICGVAPTSTALIVGRAIAGVGSAGLFSGALIIIAFQTPLERRAIYTSLITACYGIASVVGPLLGGVFTDKVTWRWCFYINLPIGGATALALLFFLHLPHTSSNSQSTWFQTISRFDPIGTLLFTPCIVCLLLALQWGGTQYAWSDGRVIALFVVFGVLLIAFIAVQFWVGDNGTVPPRIISNRNIACGCFYSVCVGASFFIMVYYVPIWFQAILQKSAEQSGIDTLPMMIALVITSLLAGFTIAAWGYYVPFMYALVVIGPIGAGLIYTWNPATTTGEWIGYQILFGIGIGVGMQQSVLAAQACLEMADISVGVALIMFSQMFGGSLFVSVAQNKFTNTLAQGLASIPGIDAQGIINAGATEIGNSVHDQATLDKVHDVYNSALQQAFLVAVIMICLAAPGAAGMQMKSVKAPKTPPADNAEEAASGENLGEK